MIELFQYQREGVEFLKKNKRGYIAFDMGMGKTITALTAANEATEKSILVIAEKNEIVNAQNFRKEVEAHMDIPYFSLRDFELESLPEGKIVCGINPDGLAKLDVKKIRDRFGAAIIDEATIAKNTTTIRFKQIKKICKDMDLVVLLSGTPMMNGAAEIFAPLVLAGHWLGGDGTKRSREAFETIFAGGFLKRVAHTGIFYKDFRWWAKGANHVRELRWLIRDTFVFKSKAETSIFKPKDRKVERVEMSPEWHEEYYKAWDEYLEGVAEYNKTAKIEKSLENIKELQKVIENGQVYQVNSRWKAKKVAEDIASGKYGDRRIIVWTMYVETDALLQEHLSSLGVRYRTFEDLNEWKTGDEPVLIGRIKAHGKGANVPQASVALFVDMDYVPSNNVQAENRIDRPEQTRDMIVRYYLAEGAGSIDQHVQKINTDKMRKIEKFTAPFTAEEVEALAGTVMELHSKYRAEFRLLKQASEVTNR